MKYKIVNDDNLKTIEISESANWLIVLLIILIICAVFMFYGSSVNNIFNKSSTGLSITLVVGLIVIYLIWNWF